MCILFFIALAPADAQTPAFLSVNDSLYKLYQESTDTEVKLEVLSKLVDRNFYSKNRKTLVLNYFEEAEKMNRASFNTREEHILKYILSWKHENNNEFSQKIELLSDCVNYFTLSQDSALHIKSKFYLGEVLYRTGRYESSLKYLADLKNIISDIDHPLYSIAIRKLVRNYANLNQNETALEIIRELREDYEKRPNFKWDPKHMRHHLVEGMILFNLGRTDEAIKLVEIALQKSDKSMHLAILNNAKSELARYYLANGEIEKAKKLSREAYDHYEIRKVNFPSMTSVRVNLGNIYFEDGAYETAKIYYKEAIVLAKYHHRLLDHKNAVLGLLKCNVLLSDDKLSLLDQVTEFNALKDSVINEDMNLTVQDIKIKYETEKKEAAIKQLNNENKLNVENLMAARRNNVFLISSILLLVFLGIFMGYLYNNKIKAERLLQTKNQIIADSLEEKQLLLKEIHHRVKNNLQTVSSLLSLQSNFVKDNNVLNALKDGQNRVQSMALIHQNLYQDDNLRNVNIRSYFKKLINGLYQSYSVDPDRVKLNLDIADIMMDVETIIPVGLITNELVTNVFKYAFPHAEKGKLTVSLLGDNPIVLTVKDNGIGLDQKIMKEQTYSFGYQMIKAFCKKLNAELVIDSSEGTEIKITILNNKINEKNTNR